MNHWISNVVSIRNYPEADVSAPVIVFCVRFDMDSFMDGEPNVYLRVPQRPEQRLDRCPAGIFPNKTLPRQDCMLCVRRH